MMDLNNVNLIIVNLIIAIVSLGISVYVGIIYRMYVVPKPRVTVTRSPHWISGEKTEALHDYLFNNEGNAPAKKLGLHFELKSKYKIKSIGSDRPWNRDDVEGGEGNYYVELHWDELPPKNLFHLWIIAESSPDIKDLHPERYKVWYKEKLVDKYGM